MESSKLRQLAKESILDGKSINDRVLNEFINYLSAYCADLKYTETEILINDKLYNMVYQLFESVVLNKKYQLNDI